MLFPRLIVFDDAHNFGECSFNTDRCACTEVAQKVAQGPGGVPAGWVGQNGDVLGQTDCFCNRRGGAS